MGRQFIANLNDGANFFNHGFTCFAHIGHGMGFAGGDGDGEFLSAGFQGRFSAFSVGHQGHDRHVGVLEGVLNNFGGIGHLRQQMHGHKRSHLNFLQTRGHQGVKPPQFVGGGHGLLDRLQAVARAHFTDQDAFFGHGGVCKVSETQKGRWHYFP